MSSVNVQDSILTETAKRLSKALDMPIYLVAKDENKTLLMQRLVKEYASQELYRFGVLSVSNIAINMSHYGRKGVDLAYKRLGKIDNDTILAVEAIPAIISVDLELRVDTYDFAFKTIHRILKLGAMFRTPLSFSIDFKGIDFKVNTLHESNDMNVQPVVEDEVERFILPYSFKVLGYLTDLDKSPIIKTNMLKTVTSDSTADFLSEFASRNGLKPDYFEN